MDGDIRNLAESQALQLDAEGESLNGRVKVFRKIGLSILAFCLTTAVFQLLLPLLVDHSELPMLERAIVPEFFNLKNGSAQIGLAVATVLGCAMAIWGQVDTRCSDPQDQGNARSNSDQMIKREDIGKTVLIFIAIAILGAGFFLVVTWTASYYDNDIPQTFKGTDQLEWSNKVVGISVALAGSVSAIMIAWGTFRTQHEAQRRSDELWEEEARQNYFDDVARDIELHQNLLEAIEAIFAAAEKFIDDVAVLRGAGGKFSKEERASILTEMNETQDAFWHAVDAVLKTKKVSLRLGRKWDKFYAEAGNQSLSQKTLGISGYFGFSPSDGQSIGFDELNRRFRHSKHEEVTLRGLIHVAVELLAEQLSKTASEFTEKTVTELRAIAEKHVKARDDLGEIEGKFKEREKDINASIEIAAGFLSYLEAGVGEGRAAASLVGSYVTDNKFDPLENLSEEIKKGLEQLESQIDKTNEALDETEEYKDQVEELVASIGQFQATGFEKLRARSILARHGGAGSAPDDFMPALAAVAGLIVMPDTGITFTHFKGEDGGEDWHMHCGLAFLFDLMRLYSAGLQYLVDKDDYDNEFEKVRSANFESDRKRYLGEVPAKVGYLTREVLTSDKALRSGLYQCINPLGETREPEGNSVAILGKKVKFPLLNFGESPGKIRTAFVVSSAPPGGES